MVQCTGNEDLWPIRAEVQRRGRAVFELLCTFSGTERPSLLAHLLPTRLDASEIGLAAGALPYASAMTFAC